jgi:hypothetical protein
VLVVEPLKPKRHDRNGFACGETTLDAYLQLQAAQHHRDGFSTTHLLVEESAPSRILGYYSLSAAQLLLTDLQEVDRKRLPSYPVPAIRMGRLAVSSSQQGKGPAQMFHKPATATANHHAVARSAPVCQLDVEHHRYAAHTPSLPNGPRTAPQRALGGLATHVHETSGLAAYLLAHAVARCLGLREQLGVRVLIVDALHENAARFNRAYGFQPVMAKSQTFYLPLGNPHPPRQPIPTPSAGKV